MKRINEILQSSLRRRALVAWLVAAFMLLGLVACNEPRGKNVVTGAAGATETSTRTGGNDDAETQAEIDARLEANKKIAEERAAAAKTAREEPQVCKDAFDQAAYMAETLLFVRTNEDGKDEIVPRELCAEWEVDEENGRRKLKTELVEDVDSGTLKTMAKVDPNECEPIRQIPSADEFAKAAAKANEVHQAQAAVARQRAGQAGQPGGRFSPVGNLGTGMPGPGGAGALQAAQSPYGAGTNLGQGYRIALGQGSQGGGFNLGVGAGPAGVVPAGATQTTVEFDACNLDVFTQHFLVAGKKLIQESQRVAAGGDTYMANRLMSYVPQYLQMAQTCSPGSFQAAMPGIATSCGQGPLSVVNAGPQVVGGGVSAGTVFSPVCGAAAQYQDGVSYSDIGYGEIFGRMGKDIKNMPKPLLMQIGGLFEGVFDHVILRTMGPGAGGSMRVTPGMQPGVVIR